MRSCVLFALAACGRIDFGIVIDAPSCPDGFVHVPGNPTLGTPDFCAMRTEAKARDAITGVIADAGCDASCTANSLVATHLPAGVPEGKPWVQIDDVHAQLQCRALGTGFDLMSNREWMTIARDAELVADNWSGGEPGAGRMVEGNTDGTARVAVTDPEDPYSDTENSAAQAPGSGWEQRRTIVLSTGESLWDIPGNVQEWVDWTLGDPLDGAPTPCAGAELPAFACQGFAFDDYNSSTGGYSSTQGVGMILGGAGDATRRGGQISDRSQAFAGIYALNMNRFTTDTFPSTGFRCVFRR